MPDSMLQYVGNNNRLFGPVGSAESMPECELASCWIIEVSLYGTIIGARDRFHGNHEDLLKVSRNHYEFSIMHISPYHCILSVFRISEASIS